MEKEKKVVLELEEERARWLLIFLENATVQVHLSRHAAQRFAEHWKETVQQLRNALMEGSKDHGGIRRDPGHWQ